MNKRILLIFLAFMGLSSISWAFRNWRLSLVTYIVSIIFFCGLCIMMHISYKKIMKNEAELDAYAKENKLDETWLTKDQYKDLQKNGFIKLTNDKKIFKEEVQSWQMWKKEKGL